MGIVDPTVCPLRWRQVSFRMRATVQQFLGTDGAFSGVALKDAEPVHADICIIGAGAWLWRSHVIVVRVRRAGLGLCVYVCVCIGACGWPGIIPATGFLRGQPGVQFHQDGAIIVDDAFQACYVQLRRWPCGLVLCAACRLTSGVYGFFTAVLCRVFVVARLHLTCLRLAMSRASCTRGRREPQVCTPPSTTRPVVGVLLSRGVMQVLSCVMDGPPALIAPLCCGVGMFQGS